MPLPRTLALALITALSAVAGRAAPLTLTLPQPAAQTVGTVSEVGDLLLPSGPWQGGAVPGAHLPGRVSQTAWRIGQPLATIDLMQRLKADILAQGFRVTFECRTEDCGGFDFRYAVPVLPEPDMHVDLGDFRFLAAERGAEGVTLMVSRSQQAAFVQITLVGPAPRAPGAQASASAAAGADATGVTGTKAEGMGPVAPDPVEEAPTPGADPAQTTDLGARLAVEGHVALDDLAFASGKGGLEPGTYASLTALAAWLLAHPEATVVLVGHTDATGGLAGNIALSKARAQSVRQALAALGVPGAQLGAEGVGYLAPRAASLSEEGRAQNRRVEVVLTSTQSNSATTEP